MVAKPPVEHRANVSRTMPRARGNDDTRHIETPRTDERRSHRPRTETPRTDERRSHTPRIEAPRDKTPRRAWPAGRRCVYRRKCQSRRLRRAITPAPMRPRRAAAPAKPPATVPVRASFGAGVCFAGVAGVEGTGVEVTEGVGTGVAGAEGTGVAGAEGTGVAVTEGVGVGVAGVEGTGVAGVEGVGTGVEADGVGAGLFDTLRIAMSVFAPTARAFAGSFGSTVRAAASKPRIV